MYIKISHLFFGRIWPGWKFSKLLTYRRVNWSIFLSLGCHFNISFEMLVISNFIMRTRSLILFRRVLTVVRFRFINLDYILITTFLFINSRLIIWSSDLLNLLWSILLEEMLDTNPAKLTIMSSRRIEYSCPHSLTTVSHFFDNFFWLAWVFSKSYWKAFKLLKSKIAELFFII